MKKLKRILCLAIVGALLLLTACQPGTDAQGTGTGGRYLESDITPPEAAGQHLQNFLLPDGTLRCYSEGLLDLYESGDGGESWTHTPGPGASNADLAGVLNYTLLEDGSLLAALSDETGYGVAGLAKIAPDGSVTPYPLAGLDELVAAGKSPYITYLQALPQNRLLLGYGEGGMSMEGPGTNEMDDGDEDGTVDDGADSADSGDDDSADGGAAFSVGGMGSGVTALYDLETGQELARLDEGLMAATADGENLYLLDFEGNVSARGLADGSPVSGFDAQLPMGEMVFNLALGTGPDGLLASDGKRLLSAKGAGAPEVLLEGGSYAFGAPGASVEFIGAAPDGSLILSLRGASGTKLYKYTWDENATPDPAKIIKLWSLEDSPTLRAAIAALRAADPDVTVEYEVALDEEGMTAEDAIKNLNTRLVSGDGPDVMLLDGCPLESLAEKGFLADLSDLLDTGDVFSNLLSPFQSDKGLFCLPMDLRIPALLGADADLTADSLAALARQAVEGQDRPAAAPDAQAGFGALPEGERPVFDFGTLREAFDILWSSSAPEVVGDEGLDREELARLLQGLSDIAGKYGLSSGGEGGGAAVVMATSGGGGSVLTGSPIAYSMQRAKLGALTVDSLMNLRFATEPPGTQIESFPGLAQGAWQPGTIAGINADSGVKELAARLLQTMLGDEVQGSQAKGGLPVTERGLIRCIDTLNRQIAEAGMGEKLDIDLVPLIESLTRPVLAEDIITETVWSAAEKLCAGDLDLEGAVDQIEQDVKTYLAERQ